MEAIDIHERLANAVLRQKEDEQKDGDNVAVDYVKDYVKAPGIGKAVWDAVGDQVVAREKNLEVGLDEVLGKFHELLLKEEDTLARHLRACLPALCLPSVIEEMRKAVATRPDQDATTSLSFSLARPTPSDRWISVRLDLRHMGSCFDGMRRAGILDAKWSSDFHEMMVETVRELMREFGGAWGFTQSDEIEVLLPDLENPAGQHAFQGKHDKLCSLMAAHGSTFLTRLVLRHAESRKTNQVSFELRPHSKEEEEQKTTPAQALVSLRVQLSQPNSPVFQGALLHSLQPRSLHTTFNNNNDGAPVAIQAKLTLRGDPDALSPAAVRHYFEQDMARVLGVPVCVTSMGAPDFPLLVFDARMATWACEKDAMELLLWRAYDSRTNGLSCAVYFEEKKLAQLNSTEKIAWLAAHGKLPLPNGQAYGTLLRRTTVERQAMNQSTKKETTITRSVIERVANGDLLTMVGDGTLAFRTQSLRQRD